MSKLNDQIKIIDDFSYENYKSPTKKQFIDHGGDITYIKRKYGNYINFLLKNGYDRSSKSKIVQVYDEKGLLIFEGKTKECSYALDISDSTLRRACNGQIKLLKNMYKCRFKEI